MTFEDAVEFHSARFLEVATRVALYCRDMNHTNMESRDMKAGMEGMLAALRAAFAVKNCLSELKHNLAQQAKGGES